MLTGVDFHIMRDTVYNENVLQLSSSSYSSGHTSKANVSRSELTTMHLCGYSTLPTQQYDSAIGASVYQNSTLTSSIVSEWNAKLLTPYRDSPP